MLLINSYSLFVLAVATLTLTLSAQASDVVKLSIENFEEQTKAQTGDAGDWMVKFYAPWCGHCKSMAPVWEEVATELKGVTNIASVDMTTGNNDQLAHRFEIKGYPTILFFRGGFMVSYEKPRTKEAILEFARGGYVEDMDGEDNTAFYVPEAVPIEEPKDESESDVVILTDDNFEHLTQASTGATTGDWLVEFYAPWCGHCKSLAPTWEQLATDLKGTINVGKVDCDAQKVTKKRFEVNSFPTIKFFHKGQLFNYRGPRNAEDLTLFVKSDFTDNQDGKAVPAPVTWLDLQMKFVERRLAAAQRDVTKGNYFTVHTGIAFGGFCLVIIVGILLVMLVLPAKKKQQQAEVKSEEAKKKD